jgi:hypothetical protein
VTTGVIATIGKLSTEVNDATLKLLPATMTREVHPDLGNISKFGEFSKKKSKWH